MNIPRINISTRERNALIALLCFFAFFVNSGALNSDIMETRNLVTAREIATDGNWLVPTMNGELRLEKPPLPTWIAAVVWKAAPGNLTAQRAMPALAATGLVLMFCLFVRRLTGQNDYASVAALLLLTCYNVVQMGRLATWDIYCHAFMMAAIYFLYRGLTYDKHVWMHMVAAGAMAGLSFLSKGPVSFYALLLPMLMAFLATCKVNMKNRWLPLVAMIATCLLISSWWYVYILVAHPELATYTIHKETTSWVNHNVRPWWYYWRFFTETGAWTVLMLTSLAYPFWKKRVAMPTVYKFAFIWMAAQLVLLSLMPEKKTRYLLPMMMPCCLVMTNIIMAWQWQWRDKWQNLFFIVNAVVLIALTSIVGGLSIWMLCKGLLGWGVFAAAIICVALLLFAMVNATIDRRPMFIVANVALLFCMTEIILLPAAGRLFSNPDKKSIAAIQTDKRMAGLPLYHNADEPMQIEVVYAAGQKILPIRMDGSVMKKLPCAIVTEKTVDEELPDSLREKMNVAFVGHFNESNRWALQKHRSRNMEYYVTILSEKK